MSNHFLNAQAVQENAHSLAAALGIDTEHAEELLKAHAPITLDESEPLNVFLSEQVSKLLARTLQSAGTDADPQKAAVEILIGQIPPRSTAPTLWVSSDGDAACISRRRPNLLGVHKIHLAVLIVIACYSAAAALRLVIGDSLPFPNRDPLILDIRALGVTPAVISHQIDLCQTYLAGAGAIGNGYLWALRWFDVRGQLDIVDFDIVKAGNLKPPALVPRKRCRLEESGAAGCSGPAFVSALKARPQSRSFAGPTRKEGRFTLAAPIDSWSR